MRRKVKRRRRRRRRRRKKIKKVPNFSNNKIWQVLHSIRMR